MKFSVRTKRRMSNGNSDYVDFYRCTQYFTSVLNKSTHEIKGETAYWDGVMCGVNIVMIFAWVCKLCGLI